MNKVDTEIKYEKIIPIADRILVKVINLVNDKNADAEQSLLRDIAQRRMLNQPIKDFETTMAMNNCALVCAASVDCVWVANEDMVFFGQYAGTEMLIESQRHLMIRESDVLFILKK